jgi:hypothetical protein
MGCRMSKILGWTICGAVFGLAVVLFGIFIQWQSHGHLPSAYAITWEILTKIATGAAAGFMGALGRELFYGKSD